LEAQVSSITISYFIHSTEDEERLNSAVCKAFGLEPREISFTCAEGHYGNRLVYAKAHLVGERASEVYESVSQSLTDSAHVQLGTLIERSIDEHDALYLRFDRQNLNGGLALSDEEPIRLKVKPRFRKGGKSIMASMYRRDLRV
jgi:RNA binding exosome subunit